MLIHSNRLKKNKERIHTAQSSPSSLDPMCRHWSSHGEKKRKKKNHQITARTDGHEELWKDQAN